MNIDLTICELENLIMMCENSSRYHTGGDNEYARTAIRKIKKARSEYLKMFDRRVEGDEVDAMIDGFSLDFTGGKEA